MKSYKSRPTAIFSCALLLSISGAAQTTSQAADCATLQYKQHKSAWLCGKATVCAGDICGRPSVYNFDEDFEVVLRDHKGKELEKKSLSGDEPNFCFDGRKDGNYQIAFVLRTKGIPEPARIFPTKYRHNPKKRNDVVYMIDVTCPQKQ